MPTIEPRVDIDGRKGADSNLNVESWRSFDGGGVYECRAALCAEPEGGFSVFATRLPGVVSQGETESEAIDNIKEAFRGAIKSYVARGMPIPWEDVEIEVEGKTLERWVTVDV